MIVSNTYIRARQLMAELGLDPRRVRVVLDIEDADRLSGMRLAPDEVVWLEPPHSFPEVVERLVRRQIDASVGKEVRVGEQCWP